MREELIQLADTYLKAGDAIHDAIRESIRKAGGFVNCSNNQQEKTDMKALVFDSKKGYSETYPIRAMRLDDKDQVEVYVGTFGRPVPAGQDERGALDAPEELQHPLLSDHPVRRGSHRRIPMSIRDEMMSGRLYDASNGELLDELLRTQEMCQDYNALRITDLEGRTALLHKLIGKVGKNFIVNPPFFCDYGSNIEVGDNVFINAYCVILDEAKVTFGNNVFVAPQCGFYTAGHPLDKDLRRRKLEYSLPITIGDDVWIGGMVCVMPGVTIGAGTVIGAGSVVVNDIPEGVLAAGNPCRVIRKITPQDRDRYIR